MNFSYYFHYKSSKEILTYVPTYQVLDIINCKLSFNVKLCRNTILYAL